MSERGISSWQSNLFWQALKLVEAGSVQFYSPWPTRASLRFLPATGGPGQAQTLSLTTDQTLAEINNELVPVSDPSLPGYGALFVLDDPTSAGSISGRIFFDTPAPSDDNHDGFND